VELLRADRLEAETTAVETTTAEEQAEKQAVGPGVVRPRLAVGRSRHRSSTLRRALRRQSAFSWYNVELCVVVAWQRLAIHAARG